MSNPPPSFSSFPDLPSFAPPPKPSSSRHPSSRQSRSPDRSRKGKSRDKGDVRDDDERHSERRRRDNRDEVKRQSRRHDDDRDRVAASSSSSHHRRHRRSPSPHRFSSSRHKPYDDKHAQDFTPAKRQESAGPPELPAVNDIFYAAGRGDEANITYGSLHKYSVAKFRRAGAGSVVGLPRGFKIAREPYASDASALLMEWNERGRNKSSLRYSDKSVRSLLNASSLVIQPSAASSTSTSFNSLGDYVRFSKRRRLEEPLDAPYRTADDDNEREPFSDEDGDEGEDGAALKEGVFGRLEGLGGDEEEGVSDVETKESAYRTKQLRFSNRAKEAPLDVENWLAWARFSALAGFDDRPLASSAALAGPSAKSRSAITFTILDRAALSNPPLERDPAFVLALLEAAEEAEEPQALAVRWDRILEGPLNMDVNIWRAWGNWKMSSRSGQQGESADITLWAEEGLERLRTMWKRAAPGSLESEDLEGVEIYLLLRACFALREAGYTERALAILQAQMEITFFMPTRIASWPWAEQLASLESFWDTEAPRFGEPSARGWCNSVDPAVSVAIKPSPAAPTPSADDDPFTRWLAAETVAEESVVSARTEEDPRPVAEGLTDEDDPYKLVLFPDVQGFVVPLHSASSRMQLVYALFSFLDLPFVPPEVSTSTPFFSDVFLLNSLAHSSLARSAFFPDHLRTAGSVPRRLLGEGGMEPEQEGGIRSPYDCPVKASPVTTEALVPASIAGPSLLARHSVDERLKPVISNTLEQLRQLFPTDPRFALYALSFEASQNCKSAIKRAKSILAEHRDSLVLWNAYARLERQRGKVAESRNVYQTAVSLSSAEVKRLGAQGQGEVWTLFKGWAELEFSEGRIGHTVAMIAVAASGDFSRLDSLARPEPPVVSPLHALQTRQFFSQAIPDSLDPSAPLSMAANSTNLIYLSALFEYLVVGLQAACDVYDRHLKASIPPAAKEELHLQFGDLLYRHVSAPQSTFQPAQIRAVLERAIAAFPSNTALLGYLAATESRMRYQNRVRKVLDETVLAPATGAKGPNGFLFAIWAELWSVKGRHNEWAVRNLFERAFDRPDASQSLSLWRLALDHEIYLKQFKRAKGILYRAIKACPWAKGLYLLPFGSLRSVYSAKELEELSDLMAERRIRVRVPLDSFASGWHEDASTDGDAGDAMLEEGFPGMEERRLIQEQEERRRLMPY